MVLVSEEYLQYIIKNGQNSRIRSPQWRELLENLKWTRFQLICFYKNHSLPLPAKSALFNALLFVLKNDCVKKQINKGIDS